MSSGKDYDFIIVGAGPAGCSLARGLASSSARPSVCLIEAGGPNGDPNQRIAGNLYVQVLNPSQVKPYESTPQAHMDGRRIGLSRGKGLGGSSNVNFTCWNVGPRDDWDTIATLTGDSDWRWHHAKRRFRALENLHDTEVPAGMEAYLDTQGNDHGYDGPLHIGYEPSWGNYITSMMDIWAANGYKLNRDLGSGDPLGIGVVPKTAYRGTRVTADDLLYPVPANLDIKTNSEVHRVVFEDLRAVGVALVDGTVLKATKEVIISAGSLDTPKILMHSGLGPADQLFKFGIPVLVENKNIGQNTKDHYHATLKYARADHVDPIVAFFRDKNRQAKALREWQMYRTGEYAHLGASLNFGFFKSDAVLKSKEFEELPAEEKQRLQQPTIPTYEVSTVGIVPEYYIAPDTAPSLLQFLIFVHNMQGVGNMQLASADPTKPLDFNPGFMTHAYDRRVILEATREVLKVTNSEAFKADEAPTQPVFDAPASESDDDILNFWRGNCQSTWHTVGSCRMGQPGDKQAVVDPQLRVQGVSGLRVADLSVIPIMVCSHTQTAAYQVGMVAAEKIVAEYRLNDSVSA